MTRRLWSERRRDAHCHGASRTPVTGPPFATLEQWLAWQEGLHATEIELGLERVAEVLARLPLAGPAPLTLLVGGTNGKGSCAAYLSAMLAAGGYSVGTYTSPHLQRYNERIRLRGSDIDDAALLAAFAEVEAARQGVSLTYFEYGTLAAIAAFARAGCNARVMEVGLGGRLDAVNVLEPDGSLVVSVALDHTDWLGPDRESIGREKAGIFRAARPAICADPEPPQSLLGHAAAISATLLRWPQDFRAVDEGATWRYESAHSRLEGLPLPPLFGQVQLRNAAASLALLEACLGPARLPALARGLGQARLDGRYQRQQVGGVEWVLDVAHNPAAALALADTLGAQPRAARVRCVFGILDTKDAHGVIAALSPCVDEWLLAPTESPRAVPAATLAAHFLAADMAAPAANIAVSAAPDPRCSQWPDVTAACAAAARVSRPGDRVIVAGSFHTVAPALRFLGL